MKKQHNNNKFTLLILSLGLSSLLVGCGPVPVAAPTYPAPVVSQPQPEYVPPAPAPHAYVQPDYYIPPMQQPQPQYEPYQAPRRPVVQPRPQPKPKPKPKRPVATTTPLDDYGSVRVETYKPPPPVAQTRPLQSEGRVVVEQIPVKPVTRPAPAQSPRPAAKTTPRPAPRPNATNKLVPKPSYQYNPAVKSLLVQVKQAESQGKWGRASDVMERVLRIQSNHPQLWLRMAKIKLRMGDKAQARSMALRALQMSGNDAYVRDQAQSLIHAAR